MLVVNYIALFVVIIALGILYQKYIEAHLRRNHTDEYDEIRKYLIKDKNTDNRLNKQNKPILWIHIPYEYNSRNWADFGSRTSFELNQPYLYLTVKTIIRKCDKSFHIVMIDDNTFQHLMPEWKVNISSLAEPIKGYFRQLGMAKLLYMYGGMVVPISFLCFKDLIELFNKGTQDNKMFVCENVNESCLDSGFSNELFSPNTEFMGAYKENDMMKQFIQYIEITVSHDYTSETTFLKKFNQWMKHKLHKAEQLRLILGTDVGTKTIDKEAVNIEKLLGDEYIHFYGDMYGIWIPDKQILARRHYAWFARMNQTQILQSDFALAKYMILTIASVTNKTNNKSNTQTTVQGIANAQKKENKGNKEIENKWIGFWKVPLVQRLFGYKPLGLGDHIVKNK